MAAITDVSATLGTQAACEALGVPRATYYRHLRPMEAAGRKPPPRSRSPEERQQVLAVLHEPRFADLPPRAVYAQLLDEGKYLCSVRTMYRYVILDVYSRYVVGWMVAHQESATLAKKLIRETCEWQGVEEGQLTLHADRGTSMTFQAVAFLLADAGVTKTHSRPHVSNENPFSEAHFKTLKARPDFPARFGSLQDARAFPTDFFRWYHEEHHHSALGRLTPHAVHHGCAQAKLDARAQVLEAAFLPHPERFSCGLPRPAAPLAEVWIDRPAAGGDAP